MTRNKLRNTMSSTGCVTLQKKAQACQIRPHPLAYRQTWDAPVCRRWPICLRDHRGGDHGCGRIALADCGLRLVAKAVAGAGVSAGSLVRATYSLCNQ